MTDIPGISLRSLECSPDTVELAHACAEWGFFRLVDHGIKQSESERFLNAVRLFFAQDADSKASVRRTESNPWGYYDNELTKNRRDWKEIYDLGVDQEDARWESRTPWPAGLSDFRTTMLEWHHRCERISQTIIAAVARSLGQTSDRLQPFFAPVNSSFLRLNHYPVCESPADPAADFPETGHLGIYHHTDAGALTVLLQDDDVPGLQVRHSDKWHTVSPEPGSLIINVGDMVQVWSNDRYRAPVHRVLANPSQARYSAAFFFNPAFSTDCEPLVSESHHYRPINWGEFRAARAAGDYADVGEEVQISHYRTDG